MAGVIFAIGLNSWKQMVRDRVFCVVLVAALLMIGFSYLLATLTIVESRKILLDFGFSAVSMASGMAALYIGIVSMAREIEQRTIYSVVTKPISRSAYLLGKFLGSAAVVAAAHLLLALNLAGILWLMGESLPAGFASCLFLMLLETWIILGLAFLCSSFSSSVLAAGITIALFLIGRSNSSLLTIAEKGLTPGTRALARFLYYFTPNLERFNVRDVVAYGRPFPEEMLWTGLAYAAAFVAACLAASCLFLGKRDLP
ncbi:MAG TPA: ABC transporter permease subunit [Bdellovibrionota bacterium]|jgi:ABC-type transport system involved in multi-copper enzyme maturation permease subunit